MGTNVAGDQEVERMGCSTQNAAPRGLLTQGASHMHCAKKSHLHGCVLNNAL